MTQPEIRILVIDDNSDDRSILCELLGARGHDTLGASSGAEGLRQAQVLAPDLIILDVMMPGMDGFEVCERLRADPATAEVPVIMMTALDDRQSRLRGIAAGADEFLSKPVDTVELRVRVNAIARVNRYRRLLNERQRAETHARLLAEQAQAAAAEIAAAYDTTLEGWARALDLRDKETEGHARRVAELTVRVAHAVGVADEALIHIRRGALLHDIGKLNVPDAILHKPGPLTEEEWQIMRQHPVLAYQMLTPIAYLAPALAIPYSHHEHWDGTGYPQGLAGDAIPLAARIFALVDVWDALTNDRSYRRAWSHARTAAHIRARAGTHFDPELVEVFLRVVAEDGEQ